MIDATQLQENLERIRERIARACRRAGRSPESVELMAVSKQHPAEVITMAAALGVSLFGENRVQEFAQKRAALCDREKNVIPANPEQRRSGSGGTCCSALPGTQIQMIGHLQSNKAKQAVEIFDGLHALDSFNLAQRVNDAANVEGKVFPVWLEIKLSPEPAKTGLLPDSTELEALLEQLPEMRSLSVQGLMTVPEWSEDPEAPRPVFRKLRDLRDAMRESHPRVPLEGISMGMSHDFETAIEEGATVVRVGTDLFGPRKPRA